MGLHVEQGRASCVPSKGKLKLIGPAPPLALPVIPVLSSQLVSVRSQKNNEKLQKTRIPAKASCTLSSINYIAMKGDSSGPG